MHHEHLQGSRGHLWRTGIQDRLDPFDGNPADIADTGIFLLGGVEDGFGYATRNSSATGERHQQDSNHEEWNNPINKPKIHDDSPRNILCQRSEALVGPFPENLPVLLKGFAR